MQSPNLATTSAMRLSSRCIPHNLARTYQLIVETPPGPAQDAYMRLAAKWWATLQKNVSISPQHALKRVSNAPLDTVSRSTSPEEPLQVPQKRVYSLVETATAENDTSSPPLKRQQHTQIRNRQDVLWRRPSTERNVQTASQGPSRRSPANPGTTAAQVAQASRVNSSSAVTPSNVTTQRSLEDQRQRNSDCVPGITSTHSPQTPLFASGPSVSTTLDRRPKETNRVRVSASLNIANPQDSTTAKSPSAHVRQPAKPKASKLKDITFGISEQANSGTLRQMRDQYYEALLSTKVMIRLRNTPMERSYSAKEATELANFFFEEMLGPSALKRLRKLIQEYNKISAEIDGLGLQPISKAAKAAADEKVPPVFQEFFRAFQQEQRSRTRPDGSVFALHSLGLSLTTHNRYLKLLEQMNTDQSCIRALAKLGFQISNGKGTKSVVRAYLCDTLDISDETLKKSLEPSKGLSILVERFGYGILTVLPPTFVQRARQWGFAKMAKAIEMLGDLAPLIRPLAELLEELIYVPIREGAPVGVEFARIDVDEPSQPFLRFIQDASKIETDRTRFTSIND